MSNAITRYDEQMAADAARWAERFKPVSAGNWMSTRAGVLSFNDTQLPGNQAAVVIVAGLYENAYYGSKFDPGNPLPPKCFAIEDAAGVMEPHASLESHPYFERQGESCASCPKAVWGSSDTGRGKACKNILRLALLPAGVYSPAGKRGWDLDLFEGEDHYRAADIACLKVPVMSVRNFETYVTELSTSLRRPPTMAVTRVALEPDAKSQFRVTFELIEQLPAELYAVTSKRAEEALAMLAEPYTPPREQPSPPAAGGIRGLRGRAA